MAAILEKTEKQIDKININKQEILNIQGLNRDIIKQENHKNNIKEKNNEEIQEIEQK